MGKSFFPAHGRRAICDQRKGADWNASGGDGRLRKEEWKISSGRWSGPSDLNTIVSNIGVNPDLSALTTPNSAMHTAFVQVGLKEDHKVSSFVYMAEVREVELMPSFHNCERTFSPADWWTPC